jgi:hypothetical protein
LKKAESKVKNSAQKETFESKKGKLAAIINSSPKRAFRKSLNFLINFFSLLQKLKKNQQNQMRKRRARQTEVGLLNIFRISFEKLIIFYFTCKLKKNLPMRTKKRLPRLKVG